jgi:hypothetical protein
VGHVAWPMTVLREGRTYCAEHSGVVNPCTGKPEGLITEYHFAPAEDGWDEYRRQCEVLVPPHPMADAGVHPRFVGVVLPQA